MIVPFHLFVNTPSLALLCWGKGWTPKKLKRATPFGREGMGNKTCAKKPKNLLPPYLKKLVIIRRE